MKEPLFLKSKFHEKIWGGSHLELFGYDLPSDQIGEYWAISAHKNGISVVKNGEFKDWKLDDLYSKHRELFGNRAENVFPLLTKILDANDWLSVQVHPDNEYALANEGELGKTESWYVISADEDSEIIYGHNAKTKDELINLIKTENWDKLLRKVKVKAGDFFYVPSGTMHAIGKGIVILETQQSSDTTYRVFDFNRKDKIGNKRELHLDKSIDVLTVPGDDLPINVGSEDDGITKFIENNFFSVEKWSIEEHKNFKKTRDYQLVTIIDGQGVLTIEDTNYPIKKGDNFIIPSTVDSWNITGKIYSISSSPTNHE